MDIDYKSTDCRKKDTKNEKFTCKRLSLEQTKYEWLKKLSCYLFYEFTVLMISLERITLTAEITLVVFISSK